MSRRKLAVILNRMINLSTKMKKAKTLMVVMTVRLTKMSRYSSPSCSSSGHLRKHVIVGDNMFSQIVVMVISMLCTLLLRFLRKLWDNFCRSSLMDSSRNKRKNRKLVRIRDKDHQLHSNSNQIRSFPERQRVISNSLRMKRMMFLMMRSQMTAVEGVVRLRVKGVILSLARAEAVEEAREGRVIVSRNLMQR